MENPNSFSCTKCRQIFGELEKKHRPNCEKLDEFGFCPKGVPYLGAENHDAFFVFSTLLTQSVDSWSGLVRYDGRLVEDICNLLNIEERFRCAVGGKVLYMISVANDHRLKKQRKERPPGDKTPG